MSHPHWSSEFDSIDYDELPDNFSAFPDFRDSGILAYDTYNEIMNSTIKPEDLIDTDNGDSGVEITFGYISEDKNNKYEIERNEIYQRLREILGKDMSEENEDEDKVTNKDLWSIYFGEGSDFMNAIVNYDRDLTYKVAIKWLHTALLCALFSLSAIDLYKFLPDKTIMEFDEYMSVWKKLHAHPFGGSVVTRLVGVTHSRSGTFLFQRLEEAFNRFTKELTVTECSRDINACCDDHKLHHEKGKGKETYGIGFRKHVRDNRVGFVNHIIGKTDLLFPMAMSWEREQDTAKTCIQWILTFLFQGHQGMNALPNLLLVTVILDH